MKKKIVFIVSFILIFAMVSVSVSAITVKDTRIPLAGGDIDFEAYAGEETPSVNPKTGDNMLLLLVLTGISLTAAGIIKKSRAK